VVLFLVQMSKVKVTGSITVHNDTSFQTTIVFHSHTLGGDTDNSKVCTLMGTF